MLFALVEAQKSPKQRIWCKSGGMKVQETEQGDGTLIYPSFISFLESPGSPRLDTGWLAEVRVAKTAMFVFTHTAG